MPRRGIPLLRADLFVANNVSESTVEVLAIIEKGRSNEWLQKGR